MKIGQVAKRLGVTTRTIRHYESLGLIATPSHTGAGYRLYTEAEVVRLEQVMSLVKLGIPLQPIKQFLRELTGSSLPPAAQMRRLVMWQLQLIKEQQRHLHELQQALEQLDFTLQINSGEPLTLAHSIAGVIGRNVDAKESWRDAWGFDRWAESYDQGLSDGASGYIPHQNYDQVLDRVTSLVAGADRVLDVGIGTGNLADRISRRHGATVVGVDQSREMLRRAREKLPEAELLEGNFLALPIAAQSVDAVVTTYALHHLPEQSKRLAVAEMVRVLRPGGRIVIGDNMFLDAAARETEHQRLLAAGQSEAWEDIEDEFLGDVGLLIGYLREHGLPAHSQQMAPWTWVVWTDATVEADTTADSDIV